jgi:outer membrane protein with beta-barrel domain
MRRAKRTALVCGACLMVAASAAAQNVTAGVKGGFVLNSIQNAGQVIDQISGYESVDVSAKTGLIGGGFVQFAFNEHISLQPEMMFVMKGVNLDIRDNLGTASANVNYLEFPIFMRFNSSINDMLRGYVMAGPAFGVKVGTGGTLNGSQGAVQGSRDFDIDPAIESKDVGLAFAGGLEWRKFMLEARYVLGLTDIATDIYIHDDHLTNRSFSILVGLHLP